MRHVWFRSLVAAILGGTYWLVPGLADASTSDHPEALSSLVALDSVVLYDDGRLSAGFDVYDLDEVERLIGAAPDSMAATVTLLGGIEADVPDLEPTEMSAHTCDGRVCINVKGSGYSVADIKVTAVQYSFDGCQAPDAYFYAKHPANSYYYHFDSWFNTYPCVTASPNAVIRWWAKTDEVPAKFMEGTRLGGQWAPNPPFSGFPTVRIRDHYINFGPIKI